MSKSIVYFRGGRREARRVVRTFVGMLTGRQPDQGGLARGVFYVLGFAALSDIQADFIKKARGGTGEDGTKWKPLSPKTIAYSRRFGPGEMTALKKAAGLGRGHNRGISSNAWNGDMYVGGRNSRGVLNAQQEASWWRHYKQALAWLAKTKPLGEAKSLAAAIAWNKIKAEGAKTMLEVYGHRQVEILRDTGVLFNSLSPGRLEGGDLPTGYTPPTGDGGSDQVFRETSAGIIVGTNVKYAARQHKTRPLFPTPVPDAWKARWLETGLSAVAEAVRRYFAIGGVA